MECQDVCERQITETGDGGVAFIDLTPTYAQLKAHKRLPNISVVGADNRNKAVRRRDCNFVKARIDIIAERFI